MMTRKVIVVPHDPNWQRAFLAESQHLAIALGENMVNIYHIGSTSIPAIYAKPIIDILIEVKDIAKVDDSPEERLRQRDREIGALGYVGMGEHGIAGRRFFRKDIAEGLRTHHIHAFETGSSQIDRHLAFRDYLISHPETALEYSELKQQLAQKYPSDIESYMDGKAEFISEIDKKAARWQSL